MQATQNGSWRHPIVGLTKMLRKSSVWKSATASCFCIASIALSSIADAHITGPYAGYISTAEFVDAFYNKTVDNMDPINVSTQKGRVNRAESSTDGAINGIGYVIGYRTPPGEGSFFFGGEIDFLLHSGNVYGDIEEKGTSEAPNQLGESWSEIWTFQRRDSYGLTLKLGASPGKLRSWKAGVYVLAGLRHASSRLDTFYNGCFKPEPCVIGDYDSGRSAKNFYVTGWTGGVGVEKRLYGQTWLQVEGRYTNYKKGRWVTPFPDLGVEVTSESVNQTAILRFNVVVR